MKKSVILSLLLVCSFKLYATEIHDAANLREPYIPEASQATAAPQATAPAGPQTTCEAAYDAGTNSPSVGEVEEAADVCKNAAAAACGAAGGTGDARLARATCLLEAAHAANVAANDRGNRATSKCERSYSRAKSDGSTGAASTAALDCQSETAKKCGPRGSTGDSHLVAAVCNLTAAHAGYLKAKSN